MTYTPIPDGTTPWGDQVNAAFTDQDSRITTNTAAIAAQPVVHLGSYVPPDWGQFWRPKRNNAANALARLSVIGDSVSEGFFATNTYTDSWVGLMRTSLQAGYGAGGSGFFSTGRTDEASSVSAPITATWQGNGSYATTTGTWTQSGLFFGPGITLLQSTAAATITFPSVRGTTIKIYNVSGAAPRANFTYSIDGGAPVPVTVTIGSTAIQVTAVTGLSTAPHTVVLSWNGAPADPLFIVGVEGENAAGVVVDNLAKSGSRTSQWVSNTSLGVPYNGGTQYPADLVVVSLGINDANNSVAGDTWLDNMTIQLQGIRAAHNGATDIILLNQHIGTFGSVPATTANLYGEYSQRIKGLADNYNAALVNMWTVGRNSWDYNNSIGYWGDPNTAGIAGTDTVHLSNFGHQTVANAITPIVLS